MAPATLHHDTPTTRCTPQRPTPNNLPNGACQWSLPKSPLTKASIGLSHDTPQCSPPRRKATSQIATQWTPPKKPTDLLVMKSLSEPCPPKQPLPSINKPKTHFHLKPTTNPRTPGSQSQYYSHAPTTSACLQMPPYPIPTKDNL